ncbi:MAG TPA: 50S ribosomal protein L25 [Acidimicrobiales bacterium]|nr:50S ribosomal protein L25 [Acidimicrobiales bacterium]
MAEVTLSVSTGRKLGSRPSNRLRADGEIPAVVYGLGTEPVPVAVKWVELRNALSTDAGLNALLDLEMDGESRLAIVKDIQRHPVRHTVHHVDFSLIDRETALSVDVPIIVEGEALSVTRENGLVDQILFNLTVWARPEHIPNEFTVDISDLTIGDAIRIADIALPEGVTTDVDPDEPVVVTSVTRAEVEEEAAEGEEGEGAESEAGEATEGGDGDEADS